MELLALITAGYKRRMACSKTRTNVEMPLYVQMRSQNRVSGYVTLPAIRSLRTRIEDITQNVRLCARRGA
jgi:ribosomal protein L39E